jgi:hypothetical protein
VATMAESSIIAPSETIHLGMLKLEVRANEAEMLQLAGAGHGAPPPWNLPALAVAIAAGRHIAQLEARVVELEKRLASAPVVREAKDLNFDQAVANLTNSDPVHYEPDPEELERSYKKRLREARALADAGAGWSAVVDYAFAGTSARAPSAVKTNQRPPTPRELSVIEKWLDRHAKRGGSL